MLRQRRSSLCTSTIIPRVTSRLSGESAHPFQDFSQPLIELLDRRNFRLADLVTISNGICGSYSLFSTARYLVTNDKDYLWLAHIFPLAGLLFDFFDGKVARWRNSSSMLGQELDSLADLVSRLILAVRPPNPPMSNHAFQTSIDIIRRGSRVISLCNWLEDSP